MIKNNLFGNTIRTVGLAAPASSCDSANLKAGIRILEQHGVNVVSGENLFALGFLAAFDHE